MTINLFALQYGVYVSKQTIFTSLNEFTFLNWKAVLL